MQTALDRKVLRVFVLLALLAGAVTIALITAQALRKTLARCNSMCNLSEIAVALHQYHDEYGCFPPAYTVNDDGKRMHSWRVLILPYVGYESLYERYRFQEPWNSPANRRLAKPMPIDYGCPPNEKTTTHFVAVVGPNTMWPGQQSTKMAAGVSDLDKILVIEIPGLDIPWMEPRDPTLEEVLDLLQHKKDIGDTSSVNYITVSGQKRTLDCNMDRESLRKMLVRDLPAKNKERNK
jgi:hypothetical protein